MRRILLLFIPLLLLAGALISSEASANTSEVYVLTVDGAITPVVADYIDRGITLAEENGAICCIIELNTPGGLASSTQVIVERIIDAEIPVVVYVLPGGWAASAGTFITMASHVAVMGPGSAIGAATPVSSSGGELPDTEAQKALNFFSAYMQTLAENRGRNVEWAELAVTESASATAEEALELNIIDFTAQGLDSLIQQLDGMEVVLDNGLVVTLHTEGANIHQVGMSGVERFLSTISDPNIAYILFTIGMLGLIVELSNPGLIFPGVLGGISLLIGLYSLGTLGANWAGVALMVLAFALFIAEAFITSHGILAVGGVASLTFGSLLLFTASPALHISGGLIAGVVSVVTICVILVVWAVVRAHRRRATTGYDGLLGKAAIAQTQLDPSGTIFIEGERWKATAEGGRVEPGEEVIVTRVEGLKVWVKKVRR